MGEPFRAKLVQRFVGHCSSCGLASKSWGVQSGPVETVCANCALDISRVVAEREPKAITSARRTQRRRAQMAVA